MPIPNDSSGQSAANPHASAFSHRFAQTRRRSIRRLEAARGYLDLGMPDHAIRELAAIGVDYRFQQARVRGEALCQLERFDEAIAAYRRALAECPDSLPIMMGLARCFQRQGQLERAVMMLEEANRLYPSEPAVLFALARSAALRDDIEGTLTWLGRAMRLCPDVAVWAETDPDFAQFRQLPDFLWFVEVAKLRIDA